MNREEAVWYYRLGGQTLGPVAWTEIEKLTQDTMDADDLLVARAGDEGWTSAAEAAAGHPELAVAAKTDGAEAEEWALFEEEEPEQPAPQEPVGQPSGAAEEVLGEAAVASDTGRRQSQTATQTTTGPGGMPVRSGLGGWLSQGWEMVMGDAASFILGLLLAGVVTVVTLGICGPPLQAGYLMMAIKRFRGEEISANTVFEGFQYFWPAWGVTLLTGLLNAVGGGVIGGGIGAALGGAGLDQQTVAMVGQTIGSVWGLLVGAALFYAMVLVVDQDMGTMDAIKNSWAETSEHFVSYVGIVFVFQLVAMAGAVLCGIGVLVTAPLVACALVAAYMYHFSSR